MAIIKSSVTEQGVYKATLVGPVEKAQVIEGWPWPKMYTRFKVEGGAETTWSVDVGPDVFYKVRALTGVSLPVDVFRQDADAILLAALQALKDKTWAGLVRVNKSGWIDQLALPGGPQLFRYVGIQTTTQEGVPFSPTTQGEYKGETYEYQFVIWRSEVVTGEHAGYFHDQFLKMPGKFPVILKNGDLEIDPRAALYKWAFAVGLDKTDPKFQLDETNPWPLLDSCAQQMAQKGHLFHATAQPSTSDKAGQVNWGTLMAVEDRNSVPADLLPVTIWGETAIPQVPQVPQATIDALTVSLCERLNAIAGKLGLEGMFIGTGKDTESKAGQTLFAHLVGPVISTFPLTGMKKFWPTFSDDPAKSWGIKGTQAMIEVLLHFENMPDENLGALVGEGKADALVEELTTVFPKLLLEPEPEPVVEDEVESNAIPF